MSCLAGEGLLRYVIGYIGTLHRLHQSNHLNLPRLTDGGVLFTGQGVPEVRRALGDALQSLAATADTLRR